MKGKEPRGSADTKYETDMKYQLVSTKFLYKYLHFILTTTKELIILRAIFLKWGKKRKKEEKEGNIKGESIVSLQINTLRIAVSPPIEFQIVSMHLLF